MRRLLLIVSIVLVMGVAASAQSDDFFRSNDAAVERDGGMANPTALGMPNTPIGDTNSANAMPLGGGLLILTAAGAGYLIMNNRKNEK